MHGSMGAANLSRFRRPPFFPARVLVRAGQRVPVDGTIINGTSEIDESRVTGETLYRPVRAGATMYAGSISVSGALTVRVTAVGASTLVEEVERLLDKATEATLADGAARGSRGAALRAGRAARPRR